MDKVDLQTKVIQLEDEIKELRVEVEYWMKQYHGITKLMAEKQRAERDHIRSVSNVDTSRYAYGGYDSDDELQSICNAMMSLEPC